MMEEGCLVHLARHFWQRVRVWSYETLILRRMRRDRVREFCRGVGVGRVEDRVVIPGVNLDSVL